MFRVGLAVSGQFLMASSRHQERKVTLFDTAEIYGFGRSERILGEALGEDRESVFLATKIFPVLPVAPVVEQRAVASASRPGTRRLGLYQVHQPHPLVRDGTIMRGMRALQRVGLAGEAGPLFLPGNLERAGDLIAARREVADAHSATPAQIALAWVIHRPAVVAIPGASSIGQLESNAAAGIELTDGEYQALNEASARFRRITGSA